MPACMSVGATKFPMMLLTLAFSANALQSGLGNSELICPTLHVDSKHWQAAAAAGVCADGQGVFQDMT